MNGQKSAPQNGLVAAVDLGSTKVACLVARQEEHGGQRIVGVGHQGSRGIACGVVVDMEAAESAVAAAVTAAEEQTGEILRRVWVNISGEGIHSRTVNVEVKIAGHEVGDADLRRIYQQSREAIGGADRDLIHAIPLGYSIDGSRGIRDPRSMVGDILGVNVLLVTALRATAANIQTCISRCHLDVDGRACSPFASGLATLVDDEMDLGVTVLDMGGRTTGIAVFFDGDCVHVDEVSVGGQDITNDIAMAFSTTTEAAERIKVIVGSASGAGHIDQDEWYDVPVIGHDPQQGTRVFHSEITQVIAPRVDQILEKILDGLDENVARIAARRIVLTGGGSQLHGLRDVVSRKFATYQMGTQVRIGTLRWLKGIDETVHGPAFATCAGLLRYGAGNLNTNRFEFRNWQLERGPIGWLGQWFRKNLGG